MLRDTFLGVVGAVLAVSIAACFALIVQVRGLDDSIDALRVELLPRSIELGVDPGHLQLSAPLSDGGPVLLFNSRRGRGESSAEWAKRSRREFEDWRAGWGS